MASHSTPALAIREAEVADAEAIADVELCSWRSAYRAILSEQVIAGFGDHAKRRRAWIDHLSQPDPRERIWVATLDGEVVGVGSAGPIRDNSEDPASVGELRSIYLVEEAWGRGVGVALLLEAEAFLRAAGFREAVTSVVSQNARARRFFEAAGWRLDGPERELLDGAIRVVPYRRGLTQRALGQ
jgi:RimJ/RimL family protein N-acetyltransferase